jgi:hypothetical protein
MPRLVVFGCSFVYGHGLPDCHQPPNLHGPVPSKMGWPSILAEKLGYECINKSVPGAGNFEIMVRLFDTVLEPDDLVIIGYSYFERYDRYRMIDKIGNGCCIAENTQQHKNMVVNMFGSTNYKEKNYWDNWLAIQHCELFLKRKNIRYLGFHNIEGHMREIKPVNLVTLENFWDKGQLVKIDLALDNRHPGIESNKMQYNLIHDKLFG